MLGVMRTVQQNSGASHAFRPFGMPAVGVPRSGISTTGVVRGFQVVQANIARAHALGSAVEAVRRPLSARSVEGSELQARVEQPFNAMVRGIQGVTRGFAALEGAQSHGEAMRAFQAIHAGAVAVSAQAEAVAQVVEDLDDEVSAEGGRSRIAQMLIDALKAIGNAAMALAKIAYDYIQILKQKAQPYAETVKAFLDQTKEIRKSLNEALKVLKAARDILQADGLLKKAEKVTELISVLEAMFKAPEAQKA